MDAMEFLLWDSEPFRTYKVRTPRAAHHCDFLASNDQLLLLELELIEPQLFFSVAMDAGGSDTANLLVDAIMKRAAASLRGSERDMRPSEKIA